MHSNHFKSTHGRNVPSRDLSHVTTDPLSPGPATHRDTVQAGAVAVVEGWPQKMTAA